MANGALIVPTDRGLFCEAGNFHIDAWKPVDRNIITHAHSDHARWGSKRYLCAKEGKELLQHRMGENAVVDAFDYDESIDMNGVRVSLHPAGHVRGSSQIRVERKGEIWIASGDYKRQSDPTCTPFELVRCHTFITECTFGLPIFRWADPINVIGDINNWWRMNRDNGRTSILLACGPSSAVRAGLGDR